MAGAGYKLFNTGDVLTAAQVNTYLQEQVVMVFASAAARTTALTGVLAEGMMSYLQDTNAVEVYNGSSWVNVGNAGDITEVQAGTGISVASGTGPIPVITNSMATTIDAKGDLIVGTGADTFARLAVGGTDGHTLQVDSSTSTGLKWAAAAGGGGKVLQVVFADYATETVVASTNYTDTGLTATITPSAATSKILILGNIAGYVTRASVSNGYAVRILRGSTVIYTPDGSSYNFHSGYVYSGGATGIDLATRAYHHYLDSPNTTSATTYKFQGRVNTTANSGAVTFQLGASNTYSSVVLMEIGA